MAAIAPFKPEVKEPEIASYAWKSHVTIPIKPEVAAAEFRKIYQQTGKVDAQEIVNRARDQKSPLHAAFEWEDGEAGKQFRLWQARNMAGSLVIVYRKPDGELTPKTRALIRIQPRADDPALDDETAAALEPRTYLPVATVMDSAELRRRYERQAFLEFANLRQRYRDVTRLGPVFDAIDRLADEFKAG